MRSLSGQVPSHHVRLPDRLPIWAVISPSSNWSGFLPFKEKMRVQAPQGMVYVQVLERKTGQTQTLAPNRVCGFESRLAHDAPLAQLVEHRTFNPRVMGSSPIGCSMRH